MVDELPPSARVLFLGSQITKKLVSGNYFSEFVDKLVIRPIEDLIFEDQDLFLIFFPEKEEIIVDFD